MGFAFDGDADRMLAVDGRGRVVDGDQILYLWGQALMAQGQLPDQRIVATVMSNLGFEKAWQAKGGLFERTAVGDQYVHQAMEELGPINIYQIYADVCLADQSKPASAAV